MDPAPPAPRPRPELLTVQEVARFLRISTRSVWRWCSSGRLPEPIRFSRVVLRWRRVDIERLIDNG